MFQTVADKLEHGLFMIQNHKFLWVNNSFTQTFDYQLDEILTKSYSDLIYPEDREKLYQIISKLQAREIEQYEIELRGVKKNGTIIDISLGVKLVQFEDKPATIGSVIDISHRKRMELELKQSKNRYQNIVENAPVGIMVHQKGVIQYANAMAANLLLAKDPNDLIGQPIGHFIHKDFAEIILNQIQKIQNLGITATPMYQKIVRLDGTSIDIESSGIPIQLDNAPAVEMMFWDVTEKKKEEEIIRFRAYYDTLTDLPNIQKFQLDFEEEFNGDKKLTILYININDLKEIYEIYGRQAGEMVLVKIGGRLSGAMSQNVLVYRMDGNRFSIVLSGEVKDKELYKIAEKVHRVVRQPIYITNTTVDVSVNIGVVYYPQDGGEFNMILQHADLAMNHAQKKNSLYKKYDG